MSTCLRYTLDTRINNKSKQLEDLAKPRSTVYDNSQRSKTPGILQLTEPIMTHFGEGIIEANHSGSMIEQRKQKLQLRRRML
jgi:hypothetical protein